MSRISSAEREQTSQKEERELQKISFVVYYTYTYIGGLACPTVFFYYERNGPITLWAAAKRVSLAFLNRGWREKECVYAPTEGFCREGRRREKALPRKERERSGGKKSRRQIKERISSSNSLSLIPSPPPSHRLAFARRPLLLLLLRCYTLAECTHGPQIESLPPSPQFRLRKNGGGMLPDDKSWIEMRQ